MSDPFADPRLRASIHATQRGITLELPLGYGKDGSVFSTSAHTAIKIYSSPRPFHTELACYLRLLECDATDLLGHSIPRYLSHDESPLALEMTIVQPPYILDFAGSRLDIPPDFPDDVLAQWESDRREEYGARWPHVQLLIHLFAENFGIYLLDVHPRNITFAET